MYFCVVNLKSDVKVAGKYQTICSHSHSHRVSEANNQMISFYVCHQSRSVGVFLCVDVLTDEFDVILLSDLTQHLVKPV